MHATYHTRLKTRIIITLERERERMRGIRGEVVLNMAAEKAWEMYRNNEIVSQINPQMLSHAFYSEGDGNPGSLRVFKLGPAVSSYVKESTEKIEKVEIGKSVTYKVIGGELTELYNPYTVTFSFNPMPGKENEMCIAEWKAEFKPLHPTVPPPHKARDAALAFLQHFDHFQLSY